MRRSLIVTLIIAMLLMIAAAASAQSGATSLKYTAVVSSDGSCEVTLLATLNLETRVDKLQFPIPADARDVSVNGDRVRSQKSGNVRMIDLSSTVRDLVGQFTFRVDYELDDVIGEDEHGKPLLTLPMLSGFDYSIDSFELSVTLPGNVPGKPAFSSGYHQASIEQSLEYTIDGAVINAKSLRSLKDQETLSMSLSVNAEMFPDAPIEITDAAFDDIMMIVCGALALFCFNMSMPITLFALAQAMPGCKGFSFGLLTFALFLGFLPACFGASAIGGFAMAAVSAVSLFLLVPALKHTVRKED